MAEKTTLSANEAWKRLLEKYPIAEEVEKTVYTESRRTRSGNSGSPA